MLGYARVLNESRGDLVDRPPAVGELVRMRSGGPLMMMEATDEEDGESVSVVAWTDKLGVLHREKLPRGLLVRARKGWLRRFT